MTHRSPARYLAPLALLGVVVALMLVIGGSGDDGEQAASPATTTEETSQDAAEQAEKAKKREARRKERERKTYTVQPGDTPSGIAEETGVSLEELEELNPDLDPQSLNVGDEIRIK